MSNPNNPSNQNPLQIIDSIYKKYLHHQWNGVLPGMLLDLWLALGTAHLILFPEKPKKFELKTIWVTNGVSGRTRQPFIEIHAEQLAKPLQLDPGEARDIAFHIFEACEAAEGDAFMFEFVKTELVKGDPQAEHIAANIISMFRKWRDDHGQNK